MLHDTGSSKGGKRKVCFGYVEAHPDLRTQARSALCVVALSGCILSSLYMLHKDDQVETFGLSW